MTVATRFLVRLALAVAALSGGLAAAQPVVPSRIPTAAAPARALPELGPLVKRPGTEQRLVPGRPPPPSKATVVSGQAIPYVAITLDELRAALNRPALQLTDTIDVPSVSGTAGLGRTPTAGTLRLTVSETLERANAAERRLNAQGATLRRPSTRRISIAPALVQALATTRSAASARFRVPPASRAHQPAVLFRLRADQAVQVSRAAAVAQGIRSAPPATLQPLVLPDQGWNFPIGDPDVISLTLGAGSHLAGTPTRVEASSTAGARLGLFGTDVELLAFTAQASSDVGGPQAKQDASTIVRILGQDVFLPGGQVSGAAAVENGSTLETARAYWVEFRFNIGPVPVLVRVGAVGTVGVLYDVAASPLYARAVLTPFARLDGYVEATPGWGYAAEVGVGGQLVILDETLEVLALLKVDDATDRGPRYAWDTYGYSTLRLLDGRLYVFVGVGYGALYERWEWDVFSWDGFRIGGYLFQNAGSMLFSGERGPNVPLQPGNFLLGVDKGQCSTCTNDGVWLECQACAPGGQPARIGMPCPGYVTNHAGALQCLPGGTYYYQVGDQVPGKCVNCFLDPARGNVLSCPMCFAQTLQFPQMFKASALTGPCLVAEVTRNADNKVTGDLRCVTPMPLPPQVPGCPAGTRCCPGSQGSCTHCVPTAEACPASLVSLAQASARALPAAVGPAATVETAVPGVARPPTTVASPPALPTGVQQGTTTPATTTPTPTPPKPTTTTTPKPVLRP